MIITVPILLAALGETISERAGVLNVGLEGMILTGAFAGFVAAWQLDSRVGGLVVAVLSGLLLAAVMAFLSIEAKVDQMVAGVGINLLAVGATTFGFDELFGDREQVTLGAVGSLKIPLLGDLGGIGRALFDQDVMVYVTFLLIPLVAFLMNRTRWGLAVRSVGEKPQAADTAGIGVRRVRWMATLTAGALAGLAGAYLSVIQLGIFRQEMSAGRGFLALAAVIFGRWRPWGVALACFVFGAADALQLRLQATSNVPVEVWWLVAILGAIGLAVVVTRYARTRRESRTTATGHLSSAPKPTMPTGATAVAAMATVLGLLLVVSGTSFSLPSQLWLALPALLALAALAVAGDSTKMPSALTIPYRRGSR
jgi:simple sugar transport system permease protein